MSCMCTDTIIQMKDNLDLAIYSMIQDVDGDCENPARNCYMCKHHTKCKVMFSKEALCWIHNNSKSMPNEMFVKLKNWAIDFHQRREGYR